jgi:hypothetical protein
MKTVAERFWERVDRRSPSECWNWLSSTNQDGYGGIRDDNGGWEKAHRIAWAMTNGPVPDGSCVLHRCDNPRCCNPAHLWLGTRADNNADKVAKGRQPRGSATGRAKLTEEDALSIRKDERSQRELGRIYGVHHSTIWSIRQGRNWAWLRSRGEAVGT